SHIFETTTIDVEQRPPREINEFVETGFLEEPSTLELEQENIIVPNHDFIMLQHKFQTMNNYRLQERRTNFDNNGEYS
ncbi:2870_t:CDS:1, partial [Scutellospora calospora]